MISDKGQARPPHRPVPIPSVAPPPARSWGWHGRPDDEVENRRRGGRGDDRADGVGHVTGPQIAVGFVAAPLGSAYGTLHVGVGAPELNGSHPHSVPLFFGAQHVAEHAQRKFRRRVGGLPGGGARIRRRVDEHDVTGGGAQRRQKQSGQLHDGEHVDIEHLPPRLRPGIRYRSRRPDGGVVHENVETAYFSGRPPEGVV